MDTKPTYKELEQKVKELDQQVFASKRAAEAIIQIKNDWEKTFDAIPELVAIIDDRYRIVRMNAAMADRLSLTPGEAVGMTCYEHVHGAKEPPSFCPHSKLLASGKRCFAEIFEERLNGYFTVSVSPIHDNEGRLIGSVHVATDIAERKQAEEALRASEDKFSTLLDFIPGVSIQGYTTDGTVFYWNKASEEVYGFTEEEVIGKNLGDLIIPPDQISQFRYALECGAKTETSGELMPAGELMLLHRNGSLVPVYSIHMVVCLKDRSNLLFCIDVDLTERKKIEKKLEAAHSKMKLKVDERTRELLLANEKMIHEIEDRKQIEEALKVNEIASNQQKMKLEHMNTALKVLLDHRDEEKKRFGEDMLSNVRTLIMPYLEKLEIGVPNEQITTFLAIIKSNLENLILPFAGILSLKNLNLTPTEIQVADLIRLGHSSKDISSLLNVSLDAVSFHRKNIRKKLGLTNKTTNLRSYLQRLSD